jgi:hypothetical protein
MSSLHFVLFRGLFALLLVLAGGLGVWGSGASPLRAGVRHASSIAPLGVLVVPVARVMPMQLRRSSPRMAWHGPEEVLATQARHLLR